eukprot:COSAG05_NODE_4802_length_1365_cov_0.864929_1_plen_330_part_10
MKTAPEPSQEMKFQNPISEEDDEDADLEDPAAAASFGADAVISEQQSKNVDKKLKKNQGGSKKKKGKPRSAQVRPESIYVIASQGSNSADKAELMAQIQHAYECDLHQLEDFILNTSNSTLWDDAWSDCAANSFKLDEIQVDLGWPEDFIDTALDKVGDVVLELINPKALLSKKGPCSGISILDGKRTKCGQQCPASCPGRATHYHQTDPSKSWISRDGHHADGSVKFNGLREVILDDRVLQIVNSTTRAFLKWRLDNRTNKWKTKKQVAKGADKWTRSFGQKIGQVLDQESIRVSAAVEAASMALKEEVVVRQTKLNSLKARMADLQEK